MRRSWLSSRLQSRPPRGNRRALLGHVTASAIGGARQGAGEDGLGLPESEKRQLQRCLEVERHQVIVGVHETTGQAGQVRCDRETLVVARSLGAPRSGTLEGWTHQSFTACTRSLPARSGASERRLDKRWWHPEELRLRIVSYARVWVKRKTLLADFPQILNACGCPCASARGWR